jgi:hypothetical protein
MKTRLHDQRDQHENRPFLPQISGQSRQIRGQARPFSLAEYRILQEENRKNPFSSEELALLKEIRQIFNATITGGLTKKTRKQHEEQAEKECKRYFGAYSSKTMLPTRTASPRPSVPRFGHHRPGLTNA